jgi:serine/threonine-protein kinase
VPRPGGSIAAASDSHALSGDDAVYRLLTKIGEGGAASVFLGRAASAQGVARTFAIKRLHAHLSADPEAQLRLVHEARVGARIHHANVVGVHALERRHGELSLVMDYVEGVSLADLLAAASSAGATVPPRVTMRAIIDACAGLTALHELLNDDGQPDGYVHRDVSPQNLLVGADGTTRVTDLGLARRIGLPSRVSDAVDGKLAYLAPEILDRGEIGVASDIFAMGVVIWESLSDKRLFRGQSDADTVRRIGLVEAPPLSRAARGLGSNLDAVVAKALAKLPSERFGSMRELGAALERAAAPMGLIASSAEVGQQVRALVGALLTERRRSATEADATLRPSSLLDGGAADDHEAPTQKRSAKILALPSRPRAITGTTDVMAAPSIAVEPACALEAPTPATLPVLPRTNPALARISHPDLREDDETTNVFSDVAAVQRMTPSEPRASLVVWATASTATPRAPQPPPMRPPPRPLPVSLDQAEAQRATTASTRPRTPSPAPNPQSVDLTSDDLAPWEGARRARRTRLALAAIIALQVIVAIAIAAGWSPWTILGIGVR